MKNKVIGAILCICIITIGTIPVVAAELKSIPEDITQDFPFVDEAIKSLEENITFGDCFVITGGPVLKLYSNVDLINGSKIQTKLIERNLNRRLLRASIILPYVGILVSNLTFSVEYKKDIVKNKSRFTYFTTNASVIYDENGTYQNVTNLSIIRNDPHKVTVENFTGLFIFMKARLFVLRAPLGTKLYQPAKFAFAGFCEKITFE